MSGINGKKVYIISIGGNLISIAGEVKQVTIRENRDSERR